MHISVVEISRILYVTRKAPWTENMSNLLKYECPDLPIYILGIALEIELQTSETCKRMLADSESLILWNFNCSRITLSTLPFCAMSLLVAIWFIISQSCFTITAHLKNTTWLWKGFDLLCGFISASHVIELRYFSKIWYQMQCLAIYFHILKLIYQICIFSDLWQFTIYNLFRFLWLNSENMLYVHGCYAFYYYSRVHRFELSSLNIANYHGSDLQSW